MGSALGTLAGDVLRIRRGLVDENLRHAFPDRPADWRARTTRCQVTVPPNQSGSTSLLRPDAP